MSPLPPAQSQVCSDKDKILLTLPKVELHRHLEGSLRLETIQDIVRQYQVNVLDEEQLQPMVLHLPGQPCTPLNLLAKFRFLRLLYQSPAVIRRVVREAISDAAADNIRHLELRFTPTALSQARAYPLPDVMDWVLDESQAASREYGITTRLIASVNRHETPLLAEAVADLAAERQAQGIVGLDLAGDEANFSPQPFVSIFQHARNQGLHTTLHTGEWSSGDAVLQALQLFEVERIAHGIHILENPAAVDLALQRQVVFEVAITSNLQTGAVENIPSHPVREMIARGLKVTLNTDNPAISQITLCSEYRRAVDEVGLSLNQVKACVLNAAQAAFLPENKRQELVASTARLLASISA